MAESDLDLLVRAAHAAGEIALSFWRRAPRAWDKPDASPVTEADMAVNAALEEMLRGARPGYGWLSEESPDTLERLSRERVFILDPIDGTRAFIDSHSHFAHSIAVAEAGQVTAAVVYLPAERLLYAATTDGPATLNGKPIRVAGDARLDGARVLTSKATMQPEAWRNGAVPPFRREFRASLAWRLCLVAEGRFDAAMTLRPAWEWDIAAGCLILERAGALVSDRRGAPIRFNTGTARADGLVAAPRGLWQELTSRLAPGAD